MRTGAGSPDSFTFEFAAEGNFENKIEYDANCEVGGNGRNSTEIKYGYGLLTTEPILITLTIGSSPLGFPSGF